MKKRIFFLLPILFSVFNLFAQSSITYSNFDNINTVTYAGYLTTLRTVNNPSKTGINISSKVGRVVSGADLYDGIYNTNVLPKIDFTQRQLFKLKVYSPRIATIAMKVENSSNGANEIVTATTTKIGQWEEISFDFSGVASATYDNIALFFDFYSTITGQMWYFDDLVLVPSLSLTNPVVSLPGVFTNNMVLQQNKQVPVWGFAPPGQSVTVTGSWGQSFVATADSNWKWQGNLQTPTAIPGQAPQYTLTVAGTSNTIVLNNILIGDVWLCSGQSNMEMPLAPSGISSFGVTNYQAEINSANYPNIRLFQAPKKGTRIPVSISGGSWSACSPTTVANFSAVAYFFARELYNSPNLNIPIGIIQVAYEGSPAQAWTKKELMTSDSALNTKYLTGPFYGTQGQPSALYNGMISPLIPFAIKGATWYQGESNAGDGTIYRKLLSTMLKGWRTDWNQGDFPFYYVQVAPCTVNLPEPQYAEFREVQSSFLSETNVGMAVTMDIGEVGDIHPRNKQDVGKRLSLLARAKTYGQNIVYSGPVFESATKEGSAMRIKYTASTIGSGLKTNNGALPANFTIAGVDKVFYPATATINGNDILVSSSSVANPQSVRYAFSNAAITNFMNNENLPAVPFRTDSSEILNNFETISPTVTPKYGSTFSVVANPNTVGNTTALVGKIGRTSTNWYELASFSSTSFVSANTTKYLHILVNYAAQPDITIRVDGTSANPDGTTDIRPLNTYTNLGGWQDLVFAINGGTSGINISSIIILTDTGFINTPAGFVLNNSNQFGYIDEIILNEDPTPRSLFTGVQKIADKSTLLGIIDEESVSGEFNVNVYPNPTSDSVTIDLENVEKPKVQIFDINGRKLYESSLNTSKKLMINIKEIITNGICFIKVTGENGSQIKKVIVK